MLELPFGSLVYRSFWVGLLCSGSYLQQKRHYFCQFSSKRLVFIIKIFSLVKKVMGNCCDAKEEQPSKLQYNAQQLSKPKNLNQLQSLPEEKQPLVEKQQYFNQSERKQLLEQPTIKEAFSSLILNDASSIKYTKLYKHKNAEMVVMHPSITRISILEKLQNQSPTNSIFIGLPNMLESRFTWRSTKNIKQPEKSFAQSFKAPQNQNSSKIQVTAK